MPETLPFKIKQLTPAWPYLLEMEDRVYKSSLIVVDDIHHWEGVRTGKVLMKCADVNGEVQVGDRVLLRGSNGKTMDGYDKSVDEKYRFCRTGDIEAILPEGCLN